MKLIAQNTEINTKYELQVRDGFAVAKDGEYRFGESVFNVGEKYSSYVEMNVKDVDRIKKYINEAQNQSDYVIVSIHSHEPNGDNNKVPADFFKEICKTCIDCGADAVIGHGPHVVRGIEIYNDCPIFYSLGNFIFQNDTVANQPSDFYEKYNLDFKNLPSNGYDYRSKNNTIGLGIDKDIWTSVIARWIVDEGKLKTIELIPIELGFTESRGTKGWPRLTDDLYVLKDIKTLSKSFGTEVIIKDGVGLIKIND